MTARSPLSSPDPARVAPCGPVGAPDALVAELAAILARGALRAFGSRERIGLALSPPSTPCSPSAVNARRSPPKRRDGEQT